MPWHTHTHIDARINTHLSTSLNDSRTTILFFSEAGLNSRTLVIFLDTDFDVTAAFPIISTEGMQPQMLMYRFVYEYIEHMSIHMSSATRVSMLQRPLVPSMAGRLPTAACTM